MQKEEFFDILNNKMSHEHEKTESLKFVTDEFPYFQIAQMLYLKSLKETSHPDFDTVLKKVALLVPDRKKLYNFINSSQKVPSEMEDLFVEGENQPVFSLEHNEIVQSGNSLIDKFLSSDIGKISRGPGREEDSFEGENEAVKKSVEEDDEIVTETLASIYFQQKKYDKALNAFRKLSLKYPEKSVYFAGRIEEIEKLKNI